MLGRDALAAALVVVIIIASLTAYAAKLSIASTAGESPPKPERVNATFTYFDYAYITYVNGSSAENTTAYFDIPTNYSDGTFNQTAYVITYGGNVSVGGSKGNFSISINLFKGSQGFVVVKVVESFLNDTALITYIAKHPSAFNFSLSSIPSSVRRKYLGKPAKVVVKYVVPAFRKWLGKLLSNDNLTWKNVSKAFIAVLAAYFIYVSGYIHYSASAMPRTLNETVIKRVGDCDDMSRVLTNLLWYYGIPAKINYGYVYIPSFNVTATLEGSAVRFLNNGPHAFVSAYIPKLKWVSLDFLAGSLLNNPFLIQYASTKAVVTKKDVQKIKKELSQFRYAEEVQVYEDHIIPAYLNTTNVVKLLKALHREALPVIALAEPKHNKTVSTNTTTTTTPSNKTRTESSTSTATPATQPKTSTTSPTHTTPVNLTKKTSTTAASSATASTTRTTKVTTTPSASATHIAKTGGRRASRTLGRTTKTLGKGAEAQTSTITSHPVSSSTSRASGRGSTQAHTSSASPTTVGSASTALRGAGGVSGAYVLGFIGCLAAFALVLLILAVLRPSIRVAESGE